MHPILGTAADGENPAIGSFVGIGFARGNPLPDLCRSQKGRGMFGRDFDKLFLV